MGSTETLPYWQINVPPSEREEECPDFMKNISAKDLGIVSTPDNCYRTITWPEVQKYVAANRIDLFQRVPTELRRYLAYKHFLVTEYGSIMAFVVSERLRWSEPIAARGKAFEDESDIKILWNDWPYGLDPRIVHLVVWTKFILEDDPATDDLTEKARKEISEFVEKKFVRKVGKENVIWFKNWKSLKSVHAVEHFHVMLFDPDPDFVRDLTNGDVPLYQKV